MASDNFFTNPMFAITVAEGTTLQLRCSANKTNAVNVMLVSLRGKKADNIRDYRRLADTNGKPILDSGNYRHGFTVTATKSIGSGTHIIIVSTYEPGQQGSFEIAIGSSAELVNTQIIP